MRADGVVVVSWSSPLQPNGVIKSYHVMYTTQPQMPVDLWILKRQVGESRFRLILAWRAFILSVFTFLVPHNPLDSESISS